MRTITVSDNVTQITRLRAMNAYLVREQDGLTLIDTMAGGSAKQIIAAAQALQAPIKRIALTHCHSDHIGSLDDLHAQLPDAEVLVPGRDARISAGDRSLLPGEGDRRIKGGWPKVASKPDALLEGGETVGSLRALASPGHTPGHIAFFHTQDGTLICGDAFQTLGGVTVAGQPNWRFPLVKLATWDPERALQSAKELRALAPSALAPGHGRPVRDPTEEMDAAIAKGRR